jgi:hypothetical protein
MEESVKRKQVRRYLKNIWNKLKHSLNLRTSISSIFTTESTIESESELLVTKGLESKISKLANDFEIASKKDGKKEKLIKLAPNSLKELKKFRFLMEGECIVDLDNRTLVHLEYLNNYNAIKQATKAVDNYYFHTLKNPSHRSDSFWKEFVEHFGAYTLYNVLPYTSSDMASTHNIDHQKCVDNLIYGLELLSNSVNQFVQEYYENYYIKLKKLDWGPFAPRPFGVFPMIAINFNTISGYHWDESDDPNSLCFLIALGEFEGGELYFPQLNIIIKLKPGQIVVFPSHLLLHGNFIVTKGIRYSIVYFVHAGFFKDSRNFKNLYTAANFEKKNVKKSDIIKDLNNTKDLNKRNKLSKAQKKQTIIPPKANDKRRSGIGK